MEQLNISSLLKDTDNLLVMLILFLLMKEKNNQPLMFALMYILLPDN